LAALVTDTKPYGRIFMKVFISWSKSLSKECAELLRDWIKCTLQASDPWVSSKDIDKGTLWFNEINDQLKDTKVGIVCLTKDNKGNPWILFESGALAKGLSINRVCTFLIDLTPADLENPLAQFNHTSPNKEGMKSLLATINKELGEKALDSRIIDQVFETYWPQFESKFSDIVSNAPIVTTTKPQRSSDEILTEILYTTRTLDKRIRSLEQNKRSSFGPNYINKNNIKICESEDVLRYKLGSELGIGIDDVRDILSSIVDLDKITFKETNDGIILFLPDLGEDENLKIRTLLNKLEKNTSTSRSWRKR